MALIITGSFVGSSWYLKEKISMALRNSQVNVINSNNNRLEQREKEEKSIGTHFTNTSMMFLQTSTLTDSFWNMSMNGKNLSYKKLVFHKFKAFFHGHVLECAKKRCKTGIFDIVGPKHMSTISTLTKVYTIYNILIHV